MSRRSRLGMRRHQPAVIAAAAAVFAPQDDASCLCWFDTESGVVLSGSDVTQWSDRSVNGRNATVPGGGVSPTRTAANASYNNKPSIDFAHINAALQVTIPATDPIIVYAVGHNGYNGAAVLNTYFWDFATGVGNKKILADATGQTGASLYDTTGFVVAGTTHFNAPNVLAASFSNTGDEALYWGDLSTAIASGNAGNTAAGTVFVIGNFGGLGISLRGSLVAIGLFNATTHDATKRAAFEAGLKTRYAL